MAKVVVIGAGFAGHTAALYLGDALGRKHDVTVINRHEYFYYIPSWVWVGVGRMPVEKTRFLLAPVYKKKNVSFVHGRATAVHPDASDQYVVVERHDDKQQVKVPYDYLLIATGPKLNYEATKGLGPKHGFTQSICTAPHAEATRDVYFEQIERMKRGQRVKMVIGTGHAGATCQGAAFEYITNIHKDLLRRGVRDKADLHWLSNERAAGDFGVRGVQTRYRGEILSSKEFIEAAFAEYGISYEVQKGVREVNQDTLYWEDFDGKYGETKYDFAMLIPQFKGVELDYIGSDGQDISNRIVNQAGFVLVDGIYGQPYDVMAKNPKSWPGLYQNQNYENIFAAGIAFAPPGPISEPHVTPNGTSISAAPPRTGMVSGIIGRVVAKNIVDLVQEGKMTHSERMTEMAAACIASMGDSLWDGQAATITVYPVVPNHERYDNPTGRDLFVTHMEMGLAGAWMKRMIHSTFMYKLRAYPGWKAIPE